MQKVCILLSTYNGDKFIEEQLESLLAQDFPNVSILIRDDGSRDRTVEILKEYSSRFPSIKCIFGENVGVKKSFWSLIEAASDDFDYYAFCDQDDYWLPAKLAVGVDSLKDKNPLTPLMYCSSLTVTDSNLVPVRTAVPPRFVGLGNLLVENFITGCTVVINRSARAVILLNNTSNYCMHDWWIALLIAVSGELVCDEKSEILYRQHGGNSVGVASGTFKRLRDGVTLIFRPDRKFDVYGQILSLRNCFLAKSMRALDLQLIDDVLRGQKSFFLRFKMLSTGRLCWRKTYRGQIKKWHFLFFGILG